jgi:hypothetical protein
MFVMPAGNATRYQIPNSLRLRKSLGAARLSRTNGTPTSTEKGTIFGWFKRGALGTTQAIIGTGATYEVVALQADDTIYFQSANGGGARARQTGQVFRDPSGWMPFVFSFDTTNTAGGTPKQQRLWIGLTEVTYFPTMDQDSLGMANPQWFLNTVVQYIGWSQNGGGGYFDGYISHMGWIDGQELDASAFFELNADGVIVPKSSSAVRTAVAVGGGARNGWGLQGSFLLFNNTADATELGRDRSQSDTDTSGNNWTLTGVSTAAGVTYDVMTDTPTNNFATLNPLDRPDGSSKTYTQGNLVLNYVSGNGPRTACTQAMSSGKWYWEVSITSANYAMGSGILKDGAALNEVLGYGDTLSWGWYAATGQKWYNSGNTAWGSAFSASTDVLGVAFDADAGDLYFYKNNSLLGGAAAFTGLTSGPYFPGLTGGASTTPHINFGQRPFTYTPPTGFKSLCTANLPAVAITKPKAHFDVTTWVSTQADAKTITGLAFQPDFFWAKERITGRSHNLFDSARGVTKSLRTDGADGEQTIAVSATGKLKTFNSDGYTFGADTDTSYGSVNYGTTNHVGWNWKAGGAPTTDNVAGAGNTPTAGSVKIDGANLGSALAGTIAATRLSANTTAGFSIVTYTGTGANATVAHGLGFAPKFFMIKGRNQTASWHGWHTALAGTEYIDINNTSAKSTLASIWNSTVPSSTVFSLGTESTVNGNTNTFVAYLFAEIPGYSKFGSYVGNSSTDGTFVHCGFRPRYVMVKISSGSTASWNIFDTGRSASNLSKERLGADLSSAEDSSGSYGIDILSNGFKLRINDTNTNWSGGTYIFMAFAEHPFGGSNVSPSPAR